MGDFSGAFETHLTVAPADDAVLLAWAERHGVKFSRIVLDRGSQPDQPMLTLRGRGTLADQRAAARAWARRLHDAGFTVVRVKIEAAPFNRGVPATVDDAVALPPHCYFEHHVKLVLTGDAEVARARAISEPHAAHLSRNARRTLADGRHERFVTQRCRGVGRPDARQRLDALVTALAADGFTPIEVEEEFVVVDDNPELDLGWIDEPAALP
jgi:hypothetical protein